MAKNFQNNRNNKFNNTKREKPNNLLKVPVCLPLDINADLRAEIISVLESTQFNKISFPIGTYRGLVEADAQNPDRILTIGYIRSYDKETETFTVVVFNGAIESVFKIAEPALEVLYAERDNKLTVITKMNVISAATKTTEDATEDFECESCKIAAAPATE